MANILFEKWLQKARFLNPLKKGALDEQCLEVRLDPLTGHQSVFNPAIKGKTATLFPDTDYGYLQARAADSADRCFLCGERWKNATPRYADSLVPGGRLIRREAVLFPNLFPLAAYHAVVMLGNSHHRAMDDFPPTLLADGLEVSLEFIRRCAESDDQAVWFTINANYLFPAGASVVHPHMQILGGPRPGTHHATLIEQSRRYTQREGSCYFCDLADAEEVAGERWIGSVGGSRWLAAFSPTGPHEIQALWPGCGCFGSWTDDDVTGFAQGLARALRTYHELGLSTFNFSLFGGPIGGAGDDFRCFLRLINRQNVVPHYRADDYFFQKLLRCEIVLRSPEELASIARKFF